jgi:hypothetical protein
MCFPVVTCAGVRGRVNIHPHVRGAAADEAAVEAAVEAEAADPA